MTGRDIIIEATSEGRSLLTETESKELIKASGIVVNETKLARSEDEAVSISNHIGYPVALKIASQDIAHKSDAGGVKLEIRSPEDVSKNYRDIIHSVAQKHPKATIQGITVQKSIPPGVEVIMGMFKDAQFGPVLMFGLGGIFVEVLKDISFRIVPLSKNDAACLIRDIKAFPLLEGCRGRDALDILSLEDALLKLSAFVEKHPEIKELDLNPIVVYPDGYTAVDARIILEHSG